MLLIVHVHQKEDDERTHYLGLGQAKPKTQNPKSQKSEFFGPAQ